VLRDGRGHWRGRRPVAALALVAAVSVAAAVALADGGSDEEPRAAPVARPVFQPVRRPTHAPALLRSDRMEVFVGRPTVTREPLPGVPGAVSLTVVVPVDVRNLRREPFTLQGDVQLRVGTTSVEPLADAAPQESVVTREVPPHGSVVGRLRFGVSGEDAQRRSARLEIVPGRGRRALRIRLALAPGGGGPEDQAAAGATGLTPTRR